MFSVAAVGLTSCTAQIWREHPTTPPAATQPAVPIVPTRHFYGPDAAQFGELYRAHRPTMPGVVVIIHGGFWLAEYDLSYGTPLAEDLARRGYTAFNLEYRRVGNGGGWPGTLDDVASGVDLLAELDVDTSRVVAVGHSAGGQLAAWAGGRSNLADGDPGARPKVNVSAVVSQAGVLDMRSAQRQQVGGRAVSDFIGGTATQVPARYRIADPIEQVPLRVSVLCIHDRNDQLVPYSQSQAYVEAATAAGGRASLIEVSGDHFSLIDPISSAWFTVVQRLPALLASG